MKNVLCATAFALTLAAGATLAPPAAHAADAYPTHQVRVIVPAPPGGTNDIVARIIAKHLGQILGQSFIVDNRGGANGAIGAQDAARAKPDGYTVFVSSPVVLTINESLVEHPSYDPEKDFSPISMLAEVSTVLVANPHVPATNLKEYIAYVRHHPGTVNMAIPAIGSVSYMLTEQLMTQEHLRIALIPYQGSGPAIQDLLGGHTDAHFENAPAVISYIQAGQLRALAVTNDQRATLLPSVPTAAEQGFPYLSTAPWFAMVVPKQVPAAIQQKLNAAVVAILQEPDVKAELNRLGAAPRWSTQADTLSFMNSERAKWRRVIKAAHITAN